MEYICYGGFLATSTNTEQTNETNQNQQMLLQETLHTLFLLKLSAGLFAFSMCW